MRTMIDEIKEKISSTEMMDSMLLLKEDTLLFNNNLLKERNNSNLRVVVGQECSPDKMQMNLQMMVFNGLIVGKIIKKKSQRLFIGLARDKMIKREQLGQVRNLEEKVESKIKNISNSNLHKEMYSKEI